MRTLKATEDQTTIGRRPDQRGAPERDTIGDNYRHIICFLCYPAFEIELLAPHDAECICGKPVRSGDAPAPRSAPQCALCDAMAEDHYRVRHGER
ncbi:hypothetical protein [Actinospica robiniae]|uniref:hypothetical protein n=1 Tax=Actinospica robiniae TaxID=304901 RepID=UPI0004071C39|nr:hypothetical protein [Actinospica robiniae]